MSGPVDYGIHYLKDTVGAPINPGLTDEVCLNIADDRYYIFNGSIWQGNAIILGNRFLFSKNGSIVAGNGISTANMRLYENHGYTQYYNIVPDSGQNILIRNSSLYYSQNMLLTYDIQMNEWLRVEAAPTINAYSKAELNNFSAVDPGASLVGVYDTLINSNATNIQDVLNDLDNAISSAASGGEINTISNVGSGGIGLFHQKTGVDLELKTINSNDSHLIISDDMLNIEIDIESDATSNNTNSTIVSRNITGDFSANIITADLNGSSDKVDSCDVNDAGATTSDLWTALKITTEIESKINGVAWQEPVEDKDLSTPPITPSNGDRYIVAVGGSGAWTGHDNDIAEWDGSSWDFVSDVEGLACYVSDEDKLYTNNGTSWITFGSVTTHNNLSGLQGGILNEYFHLTNSDKNILTGSKAANTFLSAPNGSAGNPTFRTIVDSDLPAGGTITINGSGSGLNGTGNFTTNQSGNITIDISHADTSSQLSVDNSNGNVIQDISVDGYGHIDTIDSIDLDTRYFTEIELTNATNATNSGAYLIGVFDEFSNSNSTNVQAVLNDLDSAISTTGGSVGDGQITVQGTTGLTGSGVFTVNQSVDSTITLSHADTSSQLSVDNSNGNVIQDISVDGYGHVTVLGSIDLDLRFLGINAKAADSELLDNHDSLYFATATHNHDSRYVNITGDTLTGDLTIQAELYIGNDGGGDSRLLFYDDNSDAWRTFIWDDSVNDWRIEDGAGITQKLWHGGNHGHTSGLDADLLDGLHASSFALTSAIGDGTLTINSGSGLIGNGTFTSNQSTNNTITLSHDNTSSQANVNNSNGTVIQDISVDTYGHVTVLGSIDLDARYGSIGGTIWSLKSANYTSVSNDGLFADTSGGVFTILLPVSPIIGDTVSFSDPSSSWGTNNLTIGRNGQYINGLAEDLTCDIEKCNIKLIFCNVTYGWIIQ